MTNHPIVTFVNVPDPNLCDHFFFVRPHPNLLRFRPPKEAFSDPKRKEKIGVIIICQHKSRSIVVEVNNCTIVYLNRTISDDG